jgi:hypothetical protein
MLIVATRSTERIAPSRIRCERRLDGSSHASTCAIRSARTRLVDAYSVRTRPLASSSAVPGGGRDPAVLGSGGERVVVAVVLLGVGSRELKDRPVEAGARTRSPWVENSLAATNSSSTEASASFDLQKQRILSIAADHQRDPGTGADAADAHDLASDVGQFELKSLRSNTRLRSGEANMPKFDTWASPQHWTIKPDRGADARSAAMMFAAPR